MTTKKKEGVGGPGVGATTLDALEARIAELEAQLHRLRLKRRGMLGGLASGKIKRAPRVADERVVRAYEQAGGEGFYGSLKKTAAQLGLSVRQVSRVLKRQK